MSANENPSFVVVAAFDFSPPSALALDGAIRIAGEHPNAELYVVHVASSRGELIRLERGADSVSVARDEAEAMLAAEVRDHVSKRKADGIPEPRRIETRLRSGGGAAELVAFAAEVDADLLVIGTHGRTGVRRLLLGSVADTVVREAGCPVMVVHAKDYAEVGA